MAAPEVKNRPPLLYQPDLFFKPNYHTLIHGTPRENKGLLAVIFKTY